MLKTARPPSVTVGKEGAVNLLTVTVTIVLARRLSQEAVALHGMFIDGICRRTKFEAEIERHNLISPDPGQIRQNVPKRWQTHICHTS